MLLAPESQPPLAMKSTMPSSDSGPGGSVKRSPLAMISPTVAGTTTPTRIGQGKAS